MYSLAALRNGCDVVCVEPNEKLVTLIARSMVHNLHELHQGGNRTHRNPSAVLLHAAAGSEWQEVCPLLSPLSPAPVCAR